MTEQRTTWAGVCREIREIVASDIADGTVDPGDSDAVQDYAHEWADGSSWVIYYAQANAIWADTPSSVTDPAEDMIGEMPASASIQERITAAVYWMIREQIVATVDELAADRD